jgi:hypothetical protein
VEAVEPLEQRVAVRLIVQGEASLTSARGPVKPAGGPLDTPAATRETSAA